jgi:hypothetical protein
MELGMDELIGKTIRSVHVSNGQTLLRFECDEGPVVFHVEGDCCSDSWFADVVGYHALAGHTVQGVREVTLKEGEPMTEGPTSEALTAGGRTRQKRDDIYGYVVTTDAGRCTIAFRNSSNGHYGGAIEAVVHVPETTAWSAISDDWSAS